MNRDNRGFTILEVLITVIIMSVALWALSALQTISVGTNYTSHRMTIAVILAQDKMEELRMLDWADPQLADLQNNFTVDGDADGTPDNFNWTVAVDHTNVDGAGAQANPVDQNGNNIAGAIATDGYYREWNVADNMPAANMKTISVRVWWAQKKGYSVTIDTVLSEG